MCFVPARVKRTVVRSFPFFLAVFLSLLLFLSGVLFFIKMQLQDHCSRDVGLRLEKYLQERSTNALILNATQRKNGGLHGLSFVRLISDDEQFLYAESQDLKVDFQGVVNLDPRSSAVWISLDDVRARGNWTVASVELENGLVVQAGLVSGREVELYHRIREITGFAVAAAFILAGCLALICSGRSGMALKKAEKDIEQIVTKESGGLLGTKKDDELSELYDLLNRLILQNRQLVKEMQDSLDNVAHDLRTPMTRLRSVAEYGLQQNSPERLAEALSDCLEESERMLSMLGIMMSVAEAESGTMRLEKDRVRLFDSIKDVINLYEYVADAKNISMKMNIDPALTIVADTTRITQVWANIVDNAIKYGQEGGVVTIVARCSQDVAVVVFEDNGMGISVNEIDRIWERLFRGDRSRSQQGLGLGLNYVRAVVEAHGGEVAVESKLGDGSRFEVRLPVDEGG